MADDESGDDEWVTDGLFEADPDIEPGGTNVQIAGVDIQPQVVITSAVVILAFVFGTLLAPDRAELLFNQVSDGVNAAFDWVYVLAINVFILVVLYFALSKYGKIRIGGVDADKEFSDLSWFAMLFSAGMGIGLVFWSVGEPLFHFADPLFGTEPESAASAESAIALTYFHWGIHPWAVYALVGLGLAFFTFNRGLPLTFRSVFWPLLGERIYGWWGHVIDILTVFATLFGIATSLGLGALQINAGLSFLGSDVFGIAVPEGAGPQVVIIGIITAFALVSVGLGLQAGIRRLSNLNVILMTFLMLTVLLTGPTLFVLGLFPQTLGNYLSSLPELSLWTGSFDGAPYEGWQGDWTIFYWGWWIAWSPFVGMFIARISRGRTVREFILAVLFLPSLFSFVWMTIFGGTSLHFELFTDQTIVETVLEVGEEVAMFELYTLLPLTAILSAVTVLLVTTFFVTSSDSGSLVLAHITSGGLHQAPRTQRIGWALTEGVIAAVLLIGGGLAALQTAAITAGLPFALVLLVLCYSLWKGLGEEYETLESEEFAEAVDELVENRDVVVERAGTGVVTEIQDETDEEPAVDERA
ncbi:compatible solute transport protein (probable substrate choline/glycine betaine) [Natrialba magadii ATCC 43099]|uniref:Choline/carnitine/betaine transporter n=1 Tax=Natrialba magadii (strain ATCC 43099 / DSM 3394 / CCM 3739 / CIP 104546 / IAM 13178 / JCM 8861 / NBRC 102185 / NCIMB 2190 / MS3) TaxID=547559 RepID=D3SVU6_NATMM|nr:BCCT family transporter [Natrialba magadii]ADD03665.1 compatible solute transport protein (probable substrate choline/glycine betaine) [Natrialba magadii ATCC 43099]ELY34430.1 choline/carnitine/betaine transporter [Natrialba magadii ATCC 43099]